MLLYHHAYVDVSSTLLRPGHFPGKHFPDHNPEAVNVACVGNTVAIKNLRQASSREWGRGQGQTWALLEYVGSPPPMQKRDNAQKVFKHITQVYVHRRVKTLASIT